MEARDTPYRSLTVCIDRNLGVPLRDAQVLFGNSILQRYQFMEQAGKGVALRWKAAHIIPYFNKSGL